MSVVSCGHSIWDAPRRQPPGSNPQQLCDWCVTAATFSEMGLSFGTVFLAFLVVAAAFAPLTGLRANRREPVHPAVAQNERVTALAGAAIYVLLIAIGVTVLQISELLGAHYFIGFLLPAGHAQALDHRLAVCALLRCELELPPGRRGRRSFSASSSRRSWSCRPSPCLRRASSYGYSGSRSATAGRRRTPSAPWSWC